MNVGHKTVQLGREGLVAGMSCSGLLAGTRSGLLMEELLVASSLHIEELLEMVLVLMAGASILLVDELLSMGSLLTSASGWLVDML